MSASSSDVIKDWPEESREAAQLVIDTHGEAHEATESQLIWHNVGPWKRLVASRQYWRHDFPVPHIDSVESFVDHRVPIEKASSIAAFDGSVMIERTSGEVSARCHDEEANRLALNLMHDIVLGTKSVEEARDYYAHEFLSYRRKDPTPYMDELRFGPQADAADPDRRVLSDEELTEAQQEGERKQAA